MQLWCFIIPYINSAKSDCGLFQPNELITTENYQRQLTKLRPKRGAMSHRAGISLNSAPYSVTDSKLVWIFSLECPTLLLSIAIAVFETSSGFQYLTLFDRCFHSYDDTQIWTLCWCGKVKPVVVHFPFRK